MQKIETCRHKHVGYSDCFASFIIQAVYYKTISTTYVVEPKILHYLVHVLQSNTPMDILQSYVKLYLRKSGC
jgi:hypothetical protein